MRAASATRISGRVTGAEEYSVSCVGFSSSLTTEIIRDNNRVELIMG